MARKQVLSTLGGILSKFPREPCESTFEAGHATVIDGLSFVQLLPVLGFTSDKECRCAESLTISLFHSSDSKASFSWSYRGDNDIDDSKDNLFNIVNILSSI